MEDKPKYTKLSALVDDMFTVEEAYGYQFKKWDAESKRMLVEDRYAEGFRKVYSLNTNKGKLDVGSGQLSSLLEAVYKSGKADINGRTFKVKSNGKTGMDIRYYFNAVPEEKLDQIRETAQEVKDETDEPFNMDDIPFN